MKTIITDNNFAYLGKQIAEEQDIEHIVLNLDTFDDGWPNLFIDNVKEYIEHRDITYI